MDWFDTQPGGAQSAFYRAVSDPYCGKSCWNSVNVRLLAFLESRADASRQMEIRRAAGQGRPHGRASGKKPTKEAVYARSVRRHAEHSGAEENLRGVGEATPKPKSTTVDSPPAAERLVPPPEAPEVPGEGKEEATAEPEEDAEMLEEPLDTKTTPKVSTPSRGKNRTETQENLLVKKRVTMKSPKRPTTPICETKTVEENRHP